MDDDFDWPRWLDEARNDLSAIYSDTKDIRGRKLKNRRKSKIEDASELEDAFTPKLELVLFAALTTITDIEQVYLFEEVSESCESIFRKLVKTTISTLQLVQKIEDTGSEKEVDSPIARMIRRQVKLLGDLSFLDQNSWPKRVRALRELAKVDARTRYIQKFGPKGVETLHELGKIDAGERYIINILKAMPEVQNHLDS